MAILKPRHLVATAAIALLALTGCGGSSDTGSGGDEGGKGGEKTTLTVFAAASLTEVYDNLEKSFEKSHPNVDVVVTTDGSSKLVDQIKNGAPADVLATADEKNMKKATDEGLMDGEATIFATNELTIAVQPGNPKGITGLKDLTKGDIKAVRCAVPVPCGNVSEKVLKDAGTTVKFVSEETSVSDVLGKVTSGEADAGLVYVTDVARSDGKAESVTMEEAAAHRTNYPIGVTKDSKNKELAKEFIALVTGEEGQKVLGDAGFGKP